MRMNSWGSRHITMPNFLETGLSKADICNISIFQMVAATILEFWNREILSANEVQRVEAHQHVKYSQNLSIGCKDVFQRFFQFFSKWRSPPSWIFKFVKFHWQTVSGRPRLIIVLNVMKIGHFVADTLRFLKFSNGCHHHLVVSKLRNFISCWGGEGRDALACQISSKSINRLRSY